MSEVILTNHQILDQFIAKNNYKKIVVLCDSNTAINCLNKLKEQSKSTFIAIDLKQTGETIKNHKTCDILYNYLLENEINRNDLIINLGGGTVSDLGGFVASTYKRGLDYINIPTTLLAMIDAAIGGKTGINFKGLKNQIGTFHQAKAVLIDPEYLKTLPYRYLKAGYGELIKYTLISSSISLNELKLNQIPSIDLINRCIAIKQKIVASDWKEKNNRKILNIGHTAAHAFEALANEQNKVLEHGEAVVWGIYFELALAAEYLGFTHTQQYQNYIQSNFEFDVLPSIKAEDFVLKMKADKKNFNKKIAFALNKNMAEVDLDFGIDTDELIQFTKSFKWPN